MSRWQLLTHHAQVLLCVANDPGIRLRDIAEAVSITERTANRIVSELVEDDYVLRDRRGRRNVYKVNLAQAMHQPLGEERSVGDLLAVLLSKDGGAGRDGE